MSIFLRQVDMKDIQEVQVELWALNQQKEAELLAYIRYMPIFPYAGHTII